jgi:hypothetical protein
MLVILALWRQRQEDHKVPGQPGLHSVTLSQTKQNKTKQKFPETKTTRTKYRKKKIQCFNLQNISRIQSFFTIFTSTMLVQVIAISCLDY